MDVSDAIILADYTLREAEFRLWSVFVRSFTLSYKLPQDRLPRCISIGYCNFDARTLILWTERITSSTPEQVDQDLRHLLAHAEVTDHGHGPHWRLAAQRLDFLTAWDYAEPPAREVSKSMHHFSGRRSP